MEKIFFVVFWLAGSVLTAYTQDKQDKKLDSIKANTTNVTEAYFPEDHFSLIEPMNLPLAVQSVVVAHYPTAIIKSAYVNKSEQYKMEIVLKDGRSGHLYADRDGNWIER